MRRKLRISLFISLCLAVFMLSTGGVLANPRLRIRFDDDWKFRLDLPSDKRAGQLSWSWQPSQAKSLDDSPVVEGPWKPYRIGQNVLHRAPEFALFRADLDAKPLDSRVLHFESVDDNAEVYLNGVPVGRHIGYGIPFDINLTEAWKTGSVNELLVLVENTGGEGGINGDVTFQAPQSSEMVPDQAQTSFSDADWRTVHLPHDYVVEGTFSPEEDPGHGSLPRACAWYRKSFIAPAEWQGKSVWVDFDGVYRNADVFLNGKKLGHQNSGYIGFRFDLSKILDYGSKNVLSVYVDPRKDEGWWYEGAGIYRHVWMNVSDLAHLNSESIFVHTVPAAKGVHVVLAAGVDNAGPEVRNVSLVQQWQDPRGRWSTPIRANLQVNGHQSAETNMIGEIPTPILWTTDSPRLYKLQTQLFEGSKLIDSVSTNFGVRTIAFDKDRGFLLNGKPIKLKGTCNHQDHAGVGIAMPDKLLEWRLTQLKLMGSNAYRCSHNPPAPELLDDCDRMGILVMDETRHFGNTTLPKSPPGTKADDLSELKAMILRDRNHPSIIIWSLYNEEPLQGLKEGGQLFAKERQFVNSLDGTRPCSGATNWGYDEGIVDVTDLFGFNYNIGQYDKVRARHPNTAFFGSETASTVSTRGEYVNDAKKGYVSAYDANFPGWAATAEDAWRPLAERPWMAGGFVWTGFDYKGEPTPYAWPCINSHFGIIDIAGFPKDNFYYYRSAWGSKPMVHLLPSWNGPVKAGEPVDVWAYSNADRVELFLNGKSLGIKTMPKLGHVSWSVGYQPGTLEAKAYRGDQMIATDKVETTGPPVAIRLQTDRTKILGDHEDLTEVKVQLVDGKGRVVPDAANDVVFTVEGAAVIGGVGNGDPSDHDPDKANHRKAFHGLCMVLVQSNGTAGAITLHAKSDGLKMVSLSLIASHTSEK